MLSGSHFICFGGKNVGEVCGRGEGDEVKNTDDQSVLVS